MKRLSRFLAGCAIIAIACSTHVASASHFRGAAMIPTIDSNGLLTVTTTSFWRKGTAASNGLSAMTVNGFGTTFNGDNINTSDARYDVNVTTNTLQLTTAGTYDIAWSNCCRIGVGGLGNWTEDSWTMNSRIVWDGTNAAAPIAFNFASVQPEVLRGAAYSDNLSAVSPDGYALTYNQALNQNINSQIPGFTVNTSTGALSITPAGTALITDNLSNPGGDAAFSGNILSSDGSFVEFDWMFDGVDTGVPRAPQVSDAMLMGTPGTVFNHIFAITDPDNNLASPPFLPGINIIGLAPAIAPTFDPNTGALIWNSAGSAIGNYGFQVTGIDLTSLTDVGTLSIELKRSSVPAIPEPGTFVVWGLLSCVGIVAGVRFRKQ